MASSFHVENFGCRAARADGEAVSARLRVAGHCVRQATEADVVIVNTCSVTAEADRAARAFIRRAHRLNPEARIVVTGCYAQRAPEELAGLHGVAAVVGNSHKALAPGIVLELLGSTAAAHRDGGLIQIHAAAKPDRAISEQLAPPQVVSAGGMRPMRADSEQLAPPQVVSAGGMKPVRADSEQLAPPQVVSAGGMKPMRADSEQLAPPQVVSAGGMKPVRADSEQLAPPQVVIWADDRFAHSFLEEAQVEPGAQTRPNLKIQEGCGNRCTFCVIPSTRGPSKSLPGAVVLRQVEGFVAAGGKELVLSGINLGRWGRDLQSSPDENALMNSRFPTLSDEERGKDGAPSFDARFERKSAPRTLAALVEAIFERTKLERLRLSSIEPMDWDAEMIELMARYGNPEAGAARLARHAHLPLQSGSDAVLRRMHRRYRPWHYVEKVEALVRAAGPDLTVGADVMVGFPGETDAEFEETLALVRSLPFGYLHLFPFSPRPATPGWALHVEHPVPAGAVEERMKALRALAAEKSQAHRRCFVGREVEAITLHTPSEMESRGRTAALTENFLPVEIDARLHANRLVRLRVRGLNAEGTLEAEEAGPEPASRGAAVSARPQASN